MKSLASDDLDLDLLSAREREVVALAIDGRTDEQIAQALGISIGTVNTYWVRIRHKIGPLSRTEIIANLLRREMEVRCRALQEEIARLKSADTSAWRFLTLGYLCEAALVMRQDGAVLYVNPCAERLFGLGREAIEGRPLWELAFSEGPLTCEQKVRGFFANREVRRAVAGMRQPCYVRRPDGSTVRVTFAAEWYDSPDGVLATVLIREHAADIAERLLAGCVGTVVL